MGVAATAGELLTSIRRMVRLAAETNAPVGPIEMTRQHADVLARELTNDRLPSGVSQFEVLGTTVTVID